MKYISYKTLKGKVICGNVCIPRLSECEMIKNIIYYNQRPICFVTSENAHNYFVYNEDGKGLERSSLIVNIKSLLSLSQQKWSVVWDDEVCQKYKHSGHQDHWIWNQDFYSADIETLTYILNLIENAEVEDEAPNAE